MAESGAKKSSGTNLTVPLMLLAVIAIGGFLYWLNVTSAAYVEAFSAQREAVEAEAAVEGTLVAMEDLQVDPSAWVGQQIRLDGVNVVSQLGSYAFWTEFPNQAPFLVRIAQRGVLVESGWSTDVVGQVYPMSDSVLDAWAAEGVFANENQRFEAEFATSFFQAIQVTVDRGGQDNNDNGAGGAGD